MYGIAVNLLKMWWIARSARPRPNDNRRRVRGSRSALGRVHHENMAFSSTTPVKGEQQPGVATSRL